MKKIAGLTLLFSLLVATAAYAQSAADQVGRMLEYTGITQQLKDFNETMAGVFDQQSAAFDSEAYAVVSRIIGEEFGTANFYRYVSEAFVKNYDAALLSKIEKAYASTLFKEITQKEIADAGQAFEDKVKAFDYRTVNGTWNSAIEKYLRVTDTLEWQTALVKESLLSFFTTYNLFLPKAKKIAASAIDQILEQTAATISSPENLAQLKNRAALHYTGFALDDFNTYADFYDSPEGRWLMRNFMGGFNNGMKKAMQQAADRMKSELGLDGEGA